VPVHGFSPSRPSLPPLRIPLRLRARASPVAAPTHQFPHGRRAVKQSMRLLFCALVLLLAASPAAAQPINPLTLYAGQAIRFSPRTDPAWIQAHVVAADNPWTFTYTVDGANGVIYTLPYVAVDTMDVRRHSRRKGATRGALWGGFAGAGLGAVAGPFFARSNDVGSGTAVVAIGAAGG